MSTIVLDAGHGGVDGGALKGNRLEKDDTLRVVKRIKQILESNGQKVILTRDSDIYVTLQKRCDISNNASADLFVSIHRNAFNGVAHGQETFCYSLSGKSYALANAIQTSIIDAGISSANRGIKTDGLYVIKNTKAPAVLTELGFIDNDCDNKLLDDNFEKYCQCISNAILSQLGVSNKVETKLDSGIISRIQNFLNENGYTDANGKELIVDGAIGVKTKFAITKLLNTIGC